MHQADPLRNELVFYETKKREWLSSHLNQFVVIADEQVAGFFSDYEAAFKAGIQIFGIKRQFLIKQICAAEPVYVVY
jgi:hypothetical protein